MQMEGVTVNCLHLSPLSSKRKKEEEKDLSKLHAGSFVTG